MINRNGNILWGIIFVLVGIGFLGKVFNIWTFSFTSIDGWWTLFIIIPCCISLISRGPGKANIIGLTIGLILLLDQVNIIRGISVFDMAIPVVLIVIGIRFFFK